MSNLPSSSFTSLNVGTPTTASRVDLKRDITKVQHSGFQVVQQLPYTPDEQGYLFAFRVRPDYRDFVSDDPLDVVLEPPLVVPVSKRALTTSGSEAVATTIAQVKETPFINRFAKCFTKVKGDCIFRVTTNANMGTSGHLIATLVQVSPQMHAQIAPSNLGRREDSTIFTPEPRARSNFLDFDLRDGQQIGYVRMDATSNKHLEVKIPYMNDSNVYDRKIPLSSHPNYKTTGVNYNPTTDQFGKGMAQHDKEQWVLISACSPISSNTNDPLIFIIELGWENLKFYDYLGPLPKYIHANYQTAVVYDNPPSATIPGSTSWRYLRSYDWPIYWPTPISRQIRMYNGYLAITQITSITEEDARNLLKHIQIGLLNFDVFTTKVQKEMIYAGNVSREFPKSFMANLQSMHVRKLERLEDLTTTTELPYTTVAETTEGTVESLIETMSGGPPYRKTGLKTGDRLVDSRSSSSRQSRKTTHPSP